MKTIYCKRVLLKVSGEALMGEQTCSYDLNTLKGLAEDIKEVCKLGVQVCIVVGGGNIYRGIDSANLGMESSTGDYMGMLATVINALALQNTLEEQGICVRVQSAIPMTSISEPFIRKKAARHISKGRVVIFAGGIGNPYFTTDSAAVLRAVEMHCDYILKGTNVDGVYNKDPRQYSDAVKYEEINYIEIIRDNLKVMDMTAIVIAKENQLPIKVFSIKKKGNFARVLRNEGEYTIIRGN